MKRKEKKFDLKRLKNLYGPKSIDECIGLAKDFNAKTMEHNELLVELLWYLHKTNRFKDYNGYDKHDFSVFIYETFNISYSRYLELKWALHWYPQDSRDLGVHTITEIKNKTKSTVKIPRVIKEIKSELKKIKDPGKKRAVISGVIEKHTPPPVKTADTTDTKAYWKRKYDELWKKYKLVEKENQELRDQVTRLKVTGERYVKVREIVEQPHELTAH